MPPASRNARVTCDNCGTQTTKPNLARHKKRFSVGTLYCTQRANFYTKSQEDLFYLLAKKHAPQNVLLPSKVIFVIKSFQDLLLHDNVKTSNMVFLSRRQMLNLTISSTKFLVINISS